MRRARVLIVDDNAELADNLSEILASLAEYDVESVVALNARDALTIAEREDLDLALLDLHLPDATGTSLVSQLRSRAPFARIVIITGDATLESAILAVREGAFGYVLKPFRGHELIDTARRGIDQARLLREREILQRTLEASERRHRQLVEMVPAFVLALDGEARITLWNRSLEEVSGFAREEMLGHGAAELVGPSGEVRRLPTKDGGHRMVRWHRAELVASDGVRTDTYAMGVDVTGESEMLRRTLRAERLAAVGTLAAGLAHEVRNPLNSALLQLNVLERRISRGEREGERLSSVIERVKDEIGRLERLVNDFLAFAQPRPLRTAPVDLNQLVVAAADWVAPEAEQAGVSVELGLDAAPSAVDAEAEQLRQVLLNLLKNAIEAMGEGGTLRITTNGPDEHGLIVLVVADTGPGFREDQPVFDAFFTTKEGGTGLGLAIVHRIVTEHGGTIGVSSRPGDTRFTISLPARGAPAQAERAAELRGTPSPPAPRAPR